MYKNGELLGVMVMGQPMKTESISYSFSVEKSDPFYVESIKTSTKELKKDELNKSPSEKFTVDANTSMIADNNLSSSKKCITEWQKESGFSTIIPAWRAETQCFTQGEKVTYPVMTVNYSGRAKVMIKWLTRRWLFC